MQRYVGVVGPGSTDEARLLDAAEAVGALVAERGHLLVTGGLGGVMAAAVRGAAAAGGLTLALLPGADRTAAAPGNAVAVPTGLGELRNGLLVRTVDVVVAVGGSWGTLSEVALALRTGVPVLSLHGWELTGLAGPAGADASGPQPVGCDSAEEVLARIDEVLA